MKTTIIQPAKPIIFSSAMVQAILEGRKTQTRRIISGKANQLSDAFLIKDNKWWAERSAITQLGIRQGIRYTIDPPYGEPGEYLWVRETWGVHTRSSGGPATPRPGGWLGLGYRADNCGKGHILDVDMPHTYWVKPPEDDLWNYYREKQRWQKWISPIHQPRWASRITLFIDELKIERLQDISEEDARAESVMPYHRKGTSNEPGCHISARSRFGSLWDTINGERGSWAQNPWVWVITFSVADNHMQIGDMENYAKKRKK